MDYDIIALVRLINKRSFMTLLDAMNETKATRRQILYRLDKLNRLLLDESLPTITIGAHKEFVVSEATHDFLVRFLFDADDQRTYYMNREERQAYIYLMMFLDPEYLSLQYFIDSLRVSKSTALQDLKELTQMLASENIEIKNNRSDGYYLSGSEMDIRRYMMKHVMLSISDQRNTRVLDLFINDFHLNTYEYAKLVIQELAEKHHISFVEDRLTEFIYIFIFLKARLVNDNHILLNAFPMADLETMQSFKEYTFAEELLNFYPELRAMPEAETKYVCSWIVGISVGDVEDKSDDCLVIGQIVGKIMTRFELLSGIHYKDSEKIFRQIFSHFRPAYYRLLFRLPIYNPLRERVKEEYKELYSLVKETMRPFNVVFGEDVPEDELAYLTIHFAAIYTRNRESDVLPKKHALILCTHGIGSSAILYSELKHLFPEINFLLPLEVSQFNESDFPVDIIFTTHLSRDLSNAEIPVIKVSPIMDLNERYEVMREVYKQLGFISVNQPSVDEIMDVVRKHVGNLRHEHELETSLLEILTAYHKPQPSAPKGYQLLDLVSAETTLLQVEAEDWQDALRKSGAPLVEAGIVEQRYVDSIIHSKKHHVSYLVVAKNIALPHTLPKFGVNRCGIGITSLKKPIVFGNTENDPVKYIFFLSAVDNEQHLPAMQQLLEYMNDQVFLQLLDTSQDSDEIMAYIHKTSKKHTSS